MAAIMSPIITPAIEARFWAKVDKTPGQGPNGDCWCWTGAMIPAQYGQKLTYPRGMGIEGRGHRPSHVAMAIDGRPRPSEDMEGLHSCDHPPCVRLDHLRWGTGEENRAEWLARRPAGPKIIAPDVVREIRASTEIDSVIAKRLGMSQPNVYAIRKRLTHKHVI